jgi:hypothetical protein
VEAEATPLITEAVAELIALAAAMAANNPEAFRKANSRLHQLGVGRAVRIQAVNLAIQVKMAPHQDLMDMAQGALAGGGDAGCCGGEDCGDCGEGCGEEGCDCGH